MPEWTMRLLITEMMKASSGKQAAAKNHIDRINRVGMGFAEDDGSPCSTWLIEIIDLDQNVTSNSIIDCPTLSVREVSGEPASHETINKLAQIMVDLSEEDAMVTKTQPYWVDQLDTLRPNMRYEPPTTA